MRSCGLLTYVTCNVFTSVDGGVRVRGRIRPVDARPAKPCSQRSGWEINCGLHIGAGRSGQPLSASDYYGTLKIKFSLSLCDGVWPATASLSVSFCLSFCHTLTDTHTRMYVTMILLRQSSHRSSFTHEKVSTAHDDNTSIPTQSPRCYFVSQYFFNNKYNTLGADAVLPIKS